MVLNVYKITVRGYSNGKTFAQHSSKGRHKSHERGPYWKANISLLSSALGANYFSALLGGTWHAGGFFCHE